MLNLARVERLLAKLHIRDRDGKGRVPFRFNPNQQIIMERLKKWQAKGNGVNAILLKSRRVGGSALADGILVCHCMAKDMAEALIVAHQHKSSQALMKVPKMLVKDLPLPIDTSNQNKLIFPHDDGDSTLTMATAGSVVGGRGITNTALHLSEAAFYPGVESFASLVSTVTRGEEGVKIIESTANGTVGQGETFYTYWNAAVEGRNEFCPIFLTHLDDPACRLLGAKPQNVGDHPDIGDYEREMVELMRKRKQPKQEQLERIAWARATFETQCQGISLMLQQEYPICVAAETRVSTEEGIIQIVEAGKAKMSESGPIEKWGPQPPSELWEMTTRMGRILRGTYDHPVSTPDGFVRLSALKPGQVIELRPPMFARKLHVASWHIIPGATTSVVIDEAWGKFLGYFMGDGSWYKGVVSIVCDAKDIDVVEDAAVLLDSLIARPVPRTISKVKGRKGAIELRTCCKVAFDFFRRLSIIHDTESQSYYKRKVHVPEIIFRSPRSVVRQFLSALFECDGSVAKDGQVRFGSSKLDFVRDVQLLLLGFGINSTIQPNPKKNSNGYEYTFWALSLSNEGSLKFHQDIGFIGARKRGLKRTTPIKYCKTPQFQDEVLSVRATGEVDITYDFTVEGEHVFSANGILTHNTPEMAFIATGFPAFEPSEMSWANECLSEPMTTGRFQSNGKSLPGSWEVRQDGEWQLWQLPQDGHFYYLGADAAAGEEVGESGQSRQTGDFAAICIWDGVTGEQVAEMSARISPDLLADECNKAGRYYNNAMANIELTGNLGRWAQVRLRDHFNYPSFYRWKGRDDYIGKRNAMHTKTGIGWDTNPATRELMFAAFRAALRDQRVKPRSKALVNQMRVCSRIEGFRWDVRRGHDDILLAALIAWIAREQWAPPVALGGKKPEETEQPMIERVRIQDDASTALQRHHAKVMAHSKGHYTDRLIGV